MEDMISVVVPVYNVETFLEKCITSILNQTYHNLEIIIVDDGSTDSSSKLCDQMKQKDERIIVVHKKNGGLVSARKVGIARAKGEYIISIDSDDWIESEMISDLYKQAAENNADMVTSGHYREYRDSSVKCTDSIKCGIYESPQDKEYLYTNLIINGKGETWGIHPAIWCKLVKTSLMRRVYLKLNDEAVYAEDAAAVYACCVLAERIIVTHSIYYHYCLRDNSIVHSRNPNYFCNINLIYNYLRSYFEKCDNTATLLQQLDMYFVRLVFFGINNFFGLGKNVGIPYYDFPKNSIPFHAKVVLYGAGNVGQSYYKQICAEKVYCLTGWVDSNYRKYQAQGLNVMPLEKLKSLDFDYVLIALKYYQLAEEVMENLKRMFGIAESKLLWFEPISIIDKYWIKK